ncbi:MAG TPA: methionine--tRNA ligase [Kouleothrix sp.]|mgnify:CR=1 FL=1|uniref:methionine--tRNA ligase n=1 Tax=Kouleothrix sp. TaxID=2779161 RepID=UPI002CEA39B0|nr:methionine--tRNA ligase [Kouleothrix sp.]HRC76516.1 methionine--tRNA ligase [Kouleothrix sp.]
MPDHILLAVAWPYANGPRHVGHVAGFGVPSDIFARYQRLKGNHVLMVSGTDEHGTPITLAADKEGVTPKQLADRYNRVIGDDLRNLGLSYDTFTRTTTLNHYRVTQDLFKTLYDKGYILKQTALGAFSAATGRTLPDRYIEGTCPICGYGEARGDQCDNCGNQLDPVDLINPRSKVDGQPPVFRETEHFFLDLPAFAERLSQWIDSQAHWRPNVRGFSLNLLEDLRPRAITRDLDWGVPIPLPEYADRDDKRIYVWFDAVIGYLSASVEWAKNRGTPDAWREWWQSPAARHYYFMGKDNIVFHSVIWPSMLMGYGNGGAIGGNAGSPALNLPYDVVSSEFLTMEGKKFSSSRGIVIYVNDVLSRYDPDPLRYFLTIGGPETQDTDFTWAEFVRRNNDELVATWGNLVNRTLTNVHRNFGAVPQPGELTAVDHAVLAEVEAGLSSVGALLDAARFKAALGEAMKLASQVNQYLSEQEPWKVIKRDRERAATILYVALRCVDNLKIIMTPFLPFTSQKLHELLGYQGFIAGPLEFREYAEEDGSSHRVLTGDYASWVGRWQPSELPVGQALQPPAPLFKKLDESVVADELARLEHAGK